MSVFMAAFLFTAKPHSNQKWRGCEVNFIKDSKWSDWPSSPFNPICEPLEEDWHRWGYMGVCSWLGRCFLCHCYFPSGEPCELYISWFLLWYGHHDLREVMSWRWYQFYLHFFSFLSFLLHKCYSWVLLHQLGTASEITCYAEFVFDESRKQTARRSCRAVMTHIRTLCKELWAWTFGRIQVGVPRLQPLIPT